MSNSQPSLLGRFFKAFGLVVSFASFAGVAAFSIPASADDSVIDVITAKVPVSCTVAGGDHTYATTMMPDSSTELGTTTIKATCNDSAGYSLYAIGFTGESYSGNNTKLVGSLASINTGNSGPDSYWAMKATAVIGTYAPTIMNSFDSYHAIPATYAQVAKFNSATDTGSSATGSSVNITYEVSVTAAQIADTYTGKVKYVLVHPNSNVAGTYTIAYNANGGTGTMVSQTAYNFDEVTLNTMSGITAPSGYKFAGWCDVQDTSATSSNPQTTCTGTSYADAGTVPPNVANANSTYNLYAVWGEVQTIQDFATKGTCSTMSTGDTMTVVDSRDNEEYLVGKLADNKC